MLDHLIDPDPVAPDMISLVECGSESLCYYEGDDQYYTCDWFNEYNVLKDDDLIYWIEQNIPEHLVETYHKAANSCLYTFKGLLEEFTYNKETRMLEPKITKEAYADLKKMLREIDAQMVTMQMQLNDLHEMSYKVQELLLDAEDNARENYCRSGSPLDNYHQFKGWTEVMA
jgi:hypothetical protein